MGKTAIWTILRFYPLPRVNNVENNEQSLHQVMSWVRNIV